MTVPATLDWQDAGTRTWDAAVVGAGPAGALAARQLARLGLAVLLIDKATFPRAKVCGCCLNGAALATLQEIGLGDLTARLDAVPLVQTRVAVRGSQASVSLPCGSALSRTKFDAALIRAAVDAGVEFLPETTGQIGDVYREARTLNLCQVNRKTQIAARVVLAADGLGGRALAAEPAFQYYTKRGSRVGVGTVAADAPAFYVPGIIYLASGSGGYLGQVRLEDGRLDLAAAFDRARMRSLGGPGGLATAILQEVGWPVVSGLASLSWRGTLPLTRWPARLAKERLFLIGDAAGYVEPFTGEGMAWAAASAVAVAPLAAEAVRRWRPCLMGDWVGTYRRRVGRRQRTCRLVARGLSHPLLVRAVLKLLTYWPGLATPFIDRLNAP